MTSVAAVASPTRISLTTFMDFLGSTGAQKVHVVDQARDVYGKDYDPAHDYWKAVREAIRDVHPNNQPLASLASVYEKCHQSRRHNYRTAIEAYTKWVGKVVLPGQVPPRRVWTSGQLAVVVNPELDIERNGRRHLIKLYFGKDKITPTRAEATLHLLRSVMPDDAEVAVLDVLKGRIQRARAGSNAAACRAALKAEARSFVEIWNRP